MLQTNKSCTNGGNPTKKNWVTSHLNVVNFEMELVSRFWEEIPFRLFKSGILALNATKFSSKNFLFWDFVFFWPSSFISLHLNNALAFYLFEFLLRIHIWDFWLTIWHMAGVFLVLFLEFCLDFHFRLF